MGRGRQRGTEYQLPLFYGDGRAAVRPGAGGEDGIGAAASEESQEPTALDRKRALTSDLRYCQELWMGVDQAAFLRDVTPSSRSCWIPSTKVTPARTSGSRWAALSRRQRCCAMSSSL
jgi:hypothetical protein